MNFAIFWKEIREQYGILIALAVMGTGIIISAATLGTLTSDHSPFDINSYSEPARLASIVLVAVSGLVIGGMLFAGEHENGTADFFLHLPTSRYRLWIGKLIAGGILAFVMALTFWIASASVGMFTKSQMLGWWIWMIVVGMSAFSAGAFGSTLTQQVLPACGIGIAAGPMVSGLSLMAAGYSYEMYVSESGRTGRQGHVVEYMLAGSPLIAMVLFAVLSFLVFTRPDRMRHQVIMGDGAIRSAMMGIKNSRLPSSRFGIRALFWFCWRTWLLPAGFLLAISAVAGICLLIPDVPVAFVWPVIALILGTLTGVLCFASEQLHGVNRFWAERSLPTGRLWFAKMSVGLGVLLSCLILTLIPIVLLTFYQGRQFHSDDGFADFVSQMFRTKLISSGFPYSIVILLWPVYGYAGGLLAGMCFPKPLVSFAVGMMSSAMAASLWIPSLLSGGLMGWLVWPAPIIVILMSRLLMRDWTVGRIAKGRGFVKLVMAIALPILLIAGGIAYRALDVPVCPEMDDDIRFSKALPTTDDQQPGRVLKRAISQFTNIHDETKQHRAESFFGDPYTRRNWLQNPTTQHMMVDNQIGYSVHVGYPPDRLDFNFYLDVHFKNTEWLDEWRKILGKPPGVLIDPNDTNEFTPIMEIEQVGSMLKVLEVRCLQQQLAGNPAVAVEYFDLLLTAIRSMRHQTILISHLVAARHEREVVATIMRWLERLDREPVLLKKLADVLERHLQASVEDPRNLLLANQVMLRNTITNLDRWFNRYRINRSMQDRHEIEANLLQFCWNVPWEKERLHRAVGLYNSANPPPSLTDRLITQLKWPITGGTTVIASEPKTYFAGMAVSPLFEYSQGIDLFRITRQEKTRLTELRSTRLIVALRQFEAEKGHLPESLDELVPKYLSELPIDPYSAAKAPFHYERSQGKSVYMKNHEWIDVTFPGLSMGWDGTGNLNRQQFHAVMAAASGLVGFPLQSLPWALSGNEPGQELNSDMMQTIITVTGALPAVALGCPPFEQEPDRVNDFPNPATEMGMPGGGSSMGAVDYLGETIQPIVIAGMGGATAASIRWDNGLISLFSNPYKSVLSSKEWQFVPKGQGIVWSVGENGVDDGGFIHDANLGDMIFLVPPAFKAQPTNGGRTK
ncbi:MAG: ABC transporter permease [Gemmataceae bacterium]